MCSSHGSFFLVVWHDSLASLNLTSLKNLYLGVYMSFATDTLLLYMYSAPYLLHFFISPHKALYKLVHVHHA